jgi:hypothetical protein
MPTANPDRVKKLLELIENQEWLKG